MRRLAGTPGRLSTKGTRRPSMITLFSPAAVHLHQSQVRLLPVDAVPAPGIADGAAESLFRRQGGPGQVDEVVEASLLKDLVAVVELVLPGTVDADHLLGGPRLVQLQTDAPQPVDEEMVDEELPAGADLTGVGIVARPRPGRIRRQQNERQQNETQETT